MKKIINYSSAIIIPIIALYLSSTRAFHVLWRFIEYELNANKLFLVGGFVFVIWLLSRSFPALSSFCNKIKVEAKEVYKQNTKLVIVSIIIITLCWFPYISVKYKIYSQTSFQLAAIDKLAAGEYRGAKSSCRTYLRLYPQRRADGVFPDRYCLKLIERLDSYRAIYSYLQAYPIKNGVVDGLEIPIDWNAKKYATVLSDKISGIKRLQYEASNQTVKQTEYGKNVFLWGEIGLNKTKSPTGGTNKGACQFKVKTGAFSVIENAYKQKRKLVKLGYADVELIKSMDGRITRVFATCVSTKKEARHIVSKLRKSKVYSEVAQYP